MTDLTGPEPAGLILLTGFLLSTGVCALLVRFARHRLLDVPVARSAHSHATPRGGGIAIAISLFLMLSLFTLNGTLSVWQWLILMCASPVALIGFLDDLHALPVRIRLPLHLLNAALVLLLLGPVPEPFFSGWLSMPDWLQMLILIVALVWLLNLYNFMDGIDTLAVAQCVFVCGAVGLMLWSLADPLMWVCAALVAATLGFMVWNIPPARLFMGDVGSTYLGFILGVLGLMTHYSGVLSVWVWVLLMATFIADTTYTLLRRALAGVSVTEGHSSHTYQRLARRWGNHWKVTAAFTTVNLCWSLPFAWLALTYPEYGVVLAFSGIVPLMALAAALGAGKQG
ncbi:MraY family glycosyltransferase [Pseudohongiella spirulinae]|uniref:Glycosyl transferase n=1 Tax=Pseudohongiella spirulinae TaxID=1249552 RepID=A0A0S2KD86_9GAMM|nr:glycosyltransferase family 4 protein [Pseudohongiella spirulinae]ALO46279.1 glycosyl transferase [Pseudohongiella spirulinae]